MPGVQSRAFTCFDRHDCASVVQQVRCASLQASNKERGSFVPMSRRDQYLARAEQLFCIPQTRRVALQQEDRRLAAIKQALTLLWKDGPGPFSCAQVAQKAAECDGKGMTTAVLNVFMSNMSDTLRKELEGFGLAPRHQSAEKSARTLKEDDPQKIKMRYLAVIHSLPMEKRTPECIAARLGISITCVEVYLAFNTDVMGLVICGGPKTR